MTFAVTTADEGKHSIFTACAYLPYYEINKLFWAYFSMCTQMQENFFSHGLEQILGDKAIDCQWKELMMCIMPTITDTTLASLGIQ